MGAPSCKGRRGRLRGVCGGHRPMRLVARHRARSCGAQHADEELAWRSELVDEAAAWVMPVDAPAVDE
ncbi:hypothetical protein E2562_004896 [Oryza meyeriana var. granulata]|uniref:Uncharacterized protein n=1 Tax=Oryza meyeriana var. granulata TaxID=110450 RepID=A0A6G1C5R4_9ORYZ|nr:hypothetical protein E2562_004896 [Oryza meyeriana var. granulata]